MSYDLLVTCCSYIEFLAGDASNVLTFNLLQNGRNIYLPMCFLDVSSSDRVSLCKGEQKSEWRFHISNISKLTPKVSSLNSWISEIASYDLKSSEICDCFCLEYPDTPNFEGNSYLVKSWWFHTCCMFFVCFFSDKVSLAVSIFEWTCFFVCNWKCHPPRSPLWSIHIIFISSWGI